MIEIITPENISSYTRIVQDMHRHRHRIFKERMGWDVRSENQEERDQFDDCDPTYLVKLDEDGRVAASWRLLPATGPTMLRDVFPDLLDGEAPPTSPDIVETSRFAVDLPTGQSNSLASFNHATSELICGLIEYSMARGFKQVITACDLRIARLLPRLGCPPDSKTKAKRIGEWAALVARFSVRQDVLDSVRAVSGIKGSVVSNPAALILRQAA